MVSTTSSAKLLKQLPAMLAVMLLLGLSACSKEEPPQAGREQRALEYRMAVMAIEQLQTYADDMHDLGSEQSLTPENLAEKWAASMNAASAPSPDEPAITGPRFSYVANQVSSPWQVVLKVEGQVLRAYAYGSDTTVPLEQRGFEIGPH